MRVKIWMTVFGRMMGQNIPVSGGATGTSRLMARLGSAILLLNNPTVLQQRISAYHRQNSTNADSPADTVGQFFYTRRHCKARDCKAILCVCLSVCPSHSYTWTIILTIVSELRDYWTSLLSCKLLIYRHTAISNKGFRTDMGTTDH